MTEQWWRVVDEHPLEDDSESLRRIDGYRYQRFTRPIQYEPRENGSLEERAMWLEEKSDPVSARVENHAQFVAGIDVYLDPSSVSKIFDPFWNDRVLEEQDRGQIAYEYAMHCDPATVNDYFSVMVAHMEMAPAPDEFGIRYRHLIVDHYDLFRPDDFEGGIIIYAQVQQQIEQLMRMFRPTTVTMDQFNSAQMIQSLTRFASDSQLPSRVWEETASASSNQQMYENLKFSVNSGLIHSYRDHLLAGDASRCMLQAQLEHIQLRNGRVDKPRVDGMGHLDLCDCLAVLTSRLLGDQSTMMRELLTGSAMISRRDVHQDRMSLRELARSAGDNGDSPFRSIYGGNPWQTGR